MAPQLRKAAAAARQLLITLAAEQWNVEGDSIVVADGKVSHRKTDQSLDFGQLTKGQKLMKTIGEDVLTTPAERWQIAGRSVPKVNAREVGSLGGITTPQIYSVTACYTGKYCAHPPFHLH
jgi:isoquinoline 1-oxidoreductase